MRLRPRLRFLLLLLSVALLPAGCGPREGGRGPDVVLVSLDTVRADFLGAGGDPRGATPHLDRFARRGAQFAACIAQAASTLPSHASMFQSRPASRTGPGFPMLAEILQDAGWATGGFTGGGNVAGELGFDRGFDVYEEGPDLAWSLERWAEWRAGVAGPAFSFVHGYDAHVPYDPPAPYDRLYDPDYDGPVRGPDTRHLCRAVRGLEEGDPPELTEADRRHLVALYAAGLRAADARFGDLIRRLDERPEGRGAVVIVMSDHGEELWDHGSLLHSHTVYQELVHVPLLMRLPREGVEEAAGRLVAGTVRNLDLAPTVLDAVGLPAEPSHEGISLREVAGARAALPRLSAPTEMREWKALVEDRWKLITSEAGRFSLFDLEADPGEATNSASAHRDVAREMAARLAEIVEAVPVRELADDVSDELRDRLRALGYVE
jgi:arylsulfatase A-like enzyme